MSTETPPVEASDGLEFLELLRDDEPPVVPIAPFIDHRQALDTVRDWATLASSLGLLAAAFAENADAVIAAGGIPLAVLVAVLIGAGLVGAIAGATTVLADMAAAFSNLPTTPAVGGRDEARSGRDTASSVGLRQ